MAKNKASLLEKQLTPTDDLYRWWQNVRDRNTMSRFFATYSTLQLDSCLHSLTEVIKRREKAFKQQRLNALYRLEAHVLQWQKLHHLSASKRQAQVAVLADWIDNEITDNSDNGSQHAEQNQKESSYPLPLGEIRKNRRYEYSIQQGNQLEITSSSYPQSHQDLSRWWQKNSYLGFFKYRSKATKALDEAIAWYSKCIILDRCEGLQDLLNSIEVWKHERIGQSTRVDAVLLLQKRITDELSRQRQNVADTHCHHADDYIGRSSNWLSVSPSPAG